MSASALRTLLRPTRPKLLVGLGLGLFALFAYWWLDGGRWLFSPRHFGVVEPGVVYRSGQIHPRLIEGVIEEHGIRTIVDLSAGEERTPERRHEREVAARRGVRMVELETLDGSGRGEVADYVVALTEMVEARRHRRPVLVHCASGTQRTGAAVAWFRMLVDGWSGAEAYAEYMEYRYHRPDSGVLVPYVNRHTAALVERLRAAGVLERVPDPLPRFGPADAPEE